MDILDKLKDLHKQSTKELSHYYVKDTVAEAIEEIKRLRIKDRASALAVHDIKFTIDTYNEIYC